MLNNSQLDLHTHSKTCWQETRLPACFEWRIRQLEAENYGLMGLLARIQLTLREVGALLDKAEAPIDRKMKE